MEIENIKSILKIPFAFLKKMINSKFSFEKLNKIKYQKILKSKKISNERDSDQLRCIGG